MSSHLIVKKNWSAMRSVRLCELRMVATELPQKKDTNRKDKSRQEQKATIANEY